MVGDVSKAEVKKKKKKKKEGRRPGSRNSEHSDSYPTKCRTAK